MERLLTFLFKALNTRGDGILSSSELLAATGLLASKGGDGPQLARHLEEAWHSSGSREALTWQHWEAHIARSMATLPPDARMPLSEMGAQEMEQRIDTMLGQTHRDADQHFIGMASPPKATRARSRTPQPGAAQLVDRWSENQHMQPAAANGALRSPTPDATRWKDVERLSLPEARARSIMNWQLASQQQPSLAQQRPPAPRRPPRLPGKSRSMEWDSEQQSDRAFTPRTLRRSKTSWKPIGVGAAVPWEAAAETWANAMSTPRRCFERAAASVQPLRKASVQRAGEVLGDAWAACPITPLKGDYAFSPQHYSTPRGVRSTSTPRYM
mmetsp:Transcript_46877/g.111587  ORF Transcript_46877/g.111587 Transcript_46877/m.111587 type:complete len:327 (+) Transcript_46877:113-1093(+)